MPNPLIPVPAPVSEGFCPIKTHTEYETDNPEREESHRIKMQPNNNSDSTVITDAQAQEANFCLFPHA